MKPHTRTTTALLLGWITLALAPSVQVHAQPVGGTASTGTITGFVSNAATGNYLEGALVTLQPSGQTAVTGRDGKYTLPRVPEGTYELRATYTGMVEKSAAVSVSANRTVSVGFDLTADIYVIEPFVVAGEREGAARAIQAQRYAPNVKNILASDMFGNVTDDNVANFMRRLPGVTVSEDEGVARGVNIRGLTPDLSAVTVDGTRVGSGRTNGNGPTGTGGERGFDLDLISAEAIETIEVTKASTPDMDADSIGGAVNLVTKSALDRKGRSISFKIAETYNITRATFRPSATLSYSDIFGERKNLGILVTANLARSNKSRDNYRLEFEPSTDSNPLWVVSQLNDDALVNERIGGSVRLDYRLSETSTLLFTAQYSEVSNMLLRYRTVIGPNPLDTARTTQVFVRFDNGVARTASNAVARFMPGWTPDQLESINMTYTADINTRDMVAKTTALRAGGERRFASAKLDYDVSYSRSNGINARVGAGTQVPNVGFRFARIPTEWGRLASYEQTSGPDVFDLANHRISSYSLQDDTKEDRIMGAQVNFRQDVELRVPAYYRVGLRARHQERTLDLERPTFTPAAPAVIGNVERFRDEDYVYEIFDGLYRNPGFPDPDKLAAARQTNPEYFPENVVTTTRNSLQSDMAAEEKVYAAYFMGGARLDKLGLLAGIRVEETRVTGSANAQYLSPQELARRASWVGTVTPEEQQRRTQAEFGNWTTRGANYRNWFPSVHLRYDLTRQLLGRASWSTGIARPSFGNIVPTDSINDSSMTIVANNPGLRPQYADNFDLSLEYYFEPAGLVSVGAFAKEMDDFILSLSGLTVPSGADNGFGGDYAGYSLSRPVNGGKARVRGIEVAYQQRFSFLPGFWKGFGLMANYTWLDSSGDFGDYGRPGSLPGFSPKSGSGGITYSAHRLTTRLLATWQSQRPNGFSAIPGAQLHSAARWNIDLLTSFNISPRLSVFCDVRNLTDEHQGEIIQYIHPRQFQRFSTEITFGLSGRF